MHQLKLVPLVAVVVMASGCASITSDKMQSLAVTTQTTDGKLVEKAKCSLKNDKGNWQVETPGTVVVHRSAEDIVVECKKEGAPDGIARGISRAAGGMWGNIVFGGGIGAMIDHSTGTGYNYPNDLPVKMGASVTVDQADEHKNKNYNGAQPQVQAQANQTVDGKH
jgi:hypothetical protein